MKKIGLYILLVLGFYNCQPEEKPLNVVVLFTDDQRFNTINAWGNNEIHTPNMDKLAKLGVSFTNAYVMGAHHGAVCAPSRAMLLSGKPYFNIPRSYIDQGQANHTTDFDFTTFPELYRSQGYSTFFTGKWHNHTSKIRQGFTEGENIFIGGMHFPDVGGHIAPNLWHFDETGEYPKSKQWKGKQFSSEMYSDAAVDFIKKQNTENPFCLYIAYTSPHDPREAPAEYLALYDTATISLPPNYMAEHPFDNGHLRTRDENLAPFPRTKAIIKQEIAAYYAMVSEVDAQIGRVLETLEAKGLMENTVIVFAGDNGLAVGQHGLLGKQNLYEHSAHVPLIIAAPQIKGNRKAKTLTYLYDVFPTLCDLTHQKIPASVEGLSLMPVLEDEKKEIREAVYLSHAMQQRAVRRADGFKLIRYFVQGNVHSQLYDLNKDPWEMNNLANLPEYETQQTQLSQQLTKFMLSSKDDFLKPSINLKHTDFGAPVEVAITQPFKELQLHYTTDGSIPTIESPMYEKPFLVNENTTVQTQLFVEGAPYGELISAEVLISKKVKEVTISQKTPKRYSGNGKYTLMDGQRGSTEFKDGKWLGFEAEDVEIIIDLGSMQAISTVGLGFLQHFGSWIFSPKGVAISFSNNGNNYTPILKEKIKTDATDKAPKTLTFEKSIKSQKTRFVKIAIEAMKKCPEWHAGAGNNAWLFVDEVIVK